MITIATSKERNGFVGVTILTDGRFDQTALAEVYARAYAAHVASDEGFPLSSAREAVKDFVRLLDEDFGSE